VVDERRLSPGIVELERPSDRRWLPPSARDGAIGDRAMLWRDSVWRGVAVERGDWRPVLLVSEPDEGRRGLREMGSWLRRTGWVAHHAPVNRHAPQDARALARVEATLQQIYWQRRQRVVVISHGWAGRMATVAAVRYGDQVAALGAIGVPLQARAAVDRRTATRQAPSTRRASARFSADLRQPLSDEIPYTIIYSRSDPTADEYACEDRDPEEVEVFSDARGLPTDPETFRAIADLLTRVRS
jgi:pimeloyl-ACP methyl ester carboxylesterase